MMTAFEPMISAIVDDGAFKRQAENPQLTRAEALRQSMLDLMEKNSPTGFSCASGVQGAAFAGGGWRAVSRLALMSYAL